MPEKKYNNGQWTDARFKAFIVGALRNASMRWSPKNECVKEATKKAKELILSDKKRYKEYLTSVGTVKAGLFICEECETIQPASIVPPEGSKSKKKRIKNKIADHIIPIVDPIIGFAGYDEWVKRCFIERDGYACLCHLCHQKKCSEESRIRREAKKKEKILLNIHK